MSHHCYPQPMTDIARIRFANTCQLLDEFARSRNAIQELRGIETQFAAHLGITKNYWSALKSGKRHIGATLARQFEARNGKPSGWLDQENVRSTRVAPVSDTERLLTSLVLMAYRHNPEQTRTAVLKLLEDAVGVEAADRALHKTHEKAQ
jgi:hypothetical protein